MNSRTKSFMVGLLVCVSGTSLWSSERSFKVTLHVQNDDGEPVTGANAGVAYERVHAVKESERVGAAKGATDADGLLTLEGKTGEASIAYYAEKEGYYQSRGLRYNFTGSKPFRWQPWNPTIEVVLKRKKDPVPMYAKRVAVKIPEFGQPIGYDLVLGDWVAPHGKGRTPDLQFEANRHVVSDQHYDGTLTLRFSNEGDGLLGHTITQPEPPGLRMPYVAPEEGYLPTKTWQESRHMSANGEVRVISTASNRMNYFIRVRTVRDHEGKTTSALYGKVHGDFRWFIGAHAPKSGLAFTYYLNPDGTRNIEFDPKRNLLNPSGKDLREFRGLMP